MKRRASEDGFTLVELIIVVAIIGILAAVAVPRFKEAPMRAREAVLKSDLHTMRECLDQYFADKAHYPESLETLVEDGYLRSIPVDPFTGSSTTWELVYADSGGDVLPEEEGLASPGIFDVKSGATHQALDGTWVAEW